MTKEIFDKGFTVPVWIRITWSNNSWYSAWCDILENNFVPEHRPTTTLRIYPNDVIRYRDPNKKTDSTIWSGNPP